MYYTIGQFARECDALVQLAVRYAFGPEDWWWLGEQLLIQCNSVSGEYHSDGDRRKALSKYIFGKFILENRNKLNAYRISY